MPRRWQLVKNVALAGTVIVIKELGGVRTRREIWIPSTELADVYTALERKLRDGGFITKDFSYDWVTPKDHEGVVYNNVGGKRYVVAVFETHSVRNEH